VQLEVRDGDVLRVERADDGRQLLGTAVQARRRGARRSRSRSAEAPEDGLDRAAPAGLGRRDLQRGAAISAFSAPGVPRATILP
jgi:hypothetical protein